MVIEGGIPFGGVVDACTLNKGKQDVKGKDKGMRRAKGRHTMNYIFVVEQGTCGRSERRLPTFAWRRLSCVSLLVLFFFATNRLVARMKKLGRKKREKGEKIIRKQKRSRQE